MVGYSGVASPSYSGGWGTGIAWAQEVEATVSLDCTTTLQPGQQSKTLGLNNKKIMYNQIHAIYIYVLLEIVNAMKIQTQAYRIKFLKLFYGL